MIINFFLPIKPPTKTAQQKAARRVKGKTYYYEDGDLAQVRQKLLAWTGKHRPEKPLEGPLRLTVKWLFPLITRAHGGQYKDTKPDLDNIIKMLADALEQNGFYHNDSQIASMILEKFWADQVGIFVQIESIKQDF